jgi:WhiB family transcriptional regulator, redox-sensing transcriptional regulator
MCRSCPVRPECAAHALTAREPYGVWGGLTETERWHLLAIGWDDLLDRHGRRADLDRLEQRLAEHPVNGTELAARPPSQRRPIPPAQAA